MAQELPEVEFRPFWQRLQPMGLNAYEARSYLVLVGHPRFKALELAARAHVPRQKIYEVLDSLVEKGFARVIQEKTKLFSAVSPDQAIPSYVARRGRAWRRSWESLGRVKRRRTASSFPESPAQSPSPPGCQAPRRSFAAERERARRAPEL